MPKTTPPTLSKISSDDAVEAFLWGKDGRQIRLDLDGWALPPERLADVLAQSTGCKVTVIFTEKITADPA